MKMKIELIIESEETWQVLCGGKIKAILHHNLNNLKHDLGTHLNATMEDIWYTEDDSDCKTCTFNINNVDDLFSHIKNNETAINDCALSKDCIDGDDLRHEWSENKSICPHYRAADVYRQNMSLDELQEFQKELNGDLDKAIPKPEAIKKDAEKYNGNCSLCSCYVCNNQCGNCVTCNGNIVDDEHKSENEKWIENCTDCD